jgi:hypothetical protein
MGSRRIKVKRQKIYIRHPYETPATVCPQCKVRLEGATSVRTVDVPAENITGCPTICMECGCLMIFTNEHGSVRRMTEEDKQRNLSWRSHERSASRANPDVSGSLVTPREDQIQLTNTLMDDPKIIKAGPLKGKRITFASNSRISQHEATCEDFMLRIFAMDPGDYLISDESDIRDFKGMNDLSSADAIKRKIKAEYGIVPESNYLVDIFEQIDRKVH